MHVQVLKRYRDRDTKIVHEVGELVEYDNIPRIIVLARGRFVEPLESLPEEQADAEEQLQVGLNPEDSTTHVVTAADLQINLELAKAGVKEGETIALGPELSPEGAQSLQQGGTVTGPQIAIVGDDSYKTEVVVPSDVVSTGNAPVIIHGFVQETNTTTTGVDSQTEGTSSNTATGVSNTGKKKGGRPPKKEK